MPNEISLASLANGLGNLSPAWGALMAEAASVCLEDQGHGLSMPLGVDGDVNERVMTLHRDPVDERARWSHNDAERATENGAYGVSLLALQELTGLTVLLQSRRGSGFDFWLGPDSGFLFQTGLRLEISGIRRGDEVAIRRRLRSKLRQVERSQLLAPAYVAIVEFSGPTLRVVKR
jgi:hypothetical protein